ncbi:hypothetical protein BD408DRAFT_426087 [Parasitella parasitica]|nr:hypothetical protein BD408DRAFT_426087 [Parasitella parasitica]
MFQGYPQKHPIESSAHDKDPYLLFNQFPGDDNGNPTPRNKSRSTPLPVEASPYLSEKEEAEAEDIESPDSQNSKSRRMSLNKAERRAEHNAIERARRECLNSKFQQLAEALPNLHNHRRPSKGQIVEKALDWVKQNMSKEDRYQYQIIQLQNENKRLMTQINIVQEQNSSNVSPTASSSSSSTSSPTVSAPFPAALYQQQFPAHSTPTAIDTPTLLTSISINHKLRNPSCYYPPRQAEEMSPMYANNAIGYGPQHSNLSPNLSFKLNDNDSNSPSEGQQQLQMSYNDMSQCIVFDMDHPLAVESIWSSAPVPSNSGSSDNAQYTYPIGHPMYTTHL